VHDENLDKRVIYLNDLKGIIRVYRTAIDSIVEHLKLPLVLVHRLLLLLLPPLY
jgi:hypothetical protein